ncbi:hypothetical protein FGIG_02910 [Fasciola gigantica]|uniref:Uncharacterized protein n=1 Tax=Fasciola gigantica TaxID=46835 RepID=A0A504Y7U2_FASGI|nr:hypothetical protein FGIG_02910 [Fasciola gigantica]
MPSITHSYKATVLGDYDADVENVRALQHISHFVQHSFLVKDIKSVASARKQQKKFGVNSAGVLEADTCVAQSLTRCISKVSFISNV